MLLGIPIKVCDKYLNIYSGSAGGEKIAPSFKVVPNQLGFYKPRKKKLQSSIKISGVFGSFVVLFLFGSGVFFCFGVLLQCLPIPIMSN